MESASASLGTRLTKLEAMVETLFDQADQVQNDAQLIDSGLVVDGETSDGGDKLVRPASNYATTATDATLNVGSCACIDATTALVDDVNDEQEMTSSASPPPLLTAEGAAETVVPGQSTNGSEKAVADLRTEIFQLFSERDKAFVADHSQPTMPVEVDQAMISLRAELAELRVELHAESAKWAASMRSDVESRRGSDPVPLKKEISADNLKMIEAQPSQSQLSLSHPEPPSPNEESKSTAKEVSIPVVLASGGTRVPTPVSSTVITAENDDIMAMLASLSTELKQCSKLDRMEALETGLSSAIREIRSQVQHLASTVTSAGAEAAAAADAAIARWERGQEQPASQIHNVRLGSPVRTTSRAGHVDVHDNKLAQLEQMLVGLLEPHLCDGIYRGPIMYHNSGTGTGEARLNTPNRSSGLKHTGDRGARPGSRQKGSSARIQKDLQSDRERRIGALESAVTALLLAPAGGLPSNGIAESVPNNSGEDKSLKVSGRLREMTFKHDGEIKRISGQVRRLLNGLAQVQRNLKIQQPPSKEVRGQHAQSSANLSYTSRGGGSTIADAVLERVSNVNSSVQRGVPSVVAKRPSSTSGSLRVLEEEGTSIRRGMETRRTLPALH